MKSWLAVLLIAVGSSAWAECACFCAQGELRTMCQPVRAAQDNPTMCGSYSSVACPLESEQGKSVTYEAPEEGAVECRSMRVWDGLQGAYADVRVCNVLES